MNNYISMNYILLLILIVVIGLLWTMSKILNPVKRLVGVKVTPIPSKNEVEAVIEREEELVKQGQTEQQAEDTVTRETVETLVAKGEDPEEAKEAAVETVIQAKQKRKNRGPPGKLSAIPTGPLQIVGEDEDESNSL